MALRINLEIGHEASLRTKRTPEGYTHDWKIFVRGSDGADIHYYVEKVVFYLHETFPKPKRVVKEPPYEVKESGYAGFNLPIDIYLRNSGEPKKIKFNYDLHLQPTGPPISKVQKEKYFFTTMAEDFKQKLLRGGGVVTSSSQESGESKSVLYEEKNQLISKPKFGSSEPPQKKLKIEPQISNSFQDLFGPPITKTTKVSVSKAPPPKENKNFVKTEKEKNVEKNKNKHSPHKDKEKDKSEKKNKEEKKKDKERKEKEKERSREKSFKKEKSPIADRISVPIIPRDISLSPPTNSFDQNSSKYRDKEFKGEKDKKEKVDKEEKKTKKEKKEHNNREKDKHRDGNKDEHKTKKNKNKEMFPPPKQPIFNQVIPTPVTQSQTKQEKKETLKDDDRIKLDKIDKSDDKKHKHKKKDKVKKERDDGEEKSHKSSKKTEKEKYATSSRILTPTASNVTNERESLTEKNLFGSSPKTKTSSVIPSINEKEKSVKSSNKLPTTYKEEEMSESSTSSEDTMPVLENRKKEKPIKEEKQNTEKEERKKKRKASLEQEQPIEKMVKLEEPINMNNNSDIESNMDKSELNNSSNEAEEYMNTLRSMQHKIMALKDNADLQQVVKLIAETGLYEISTHTFDFDLCLLDRATVRQLQDFLSTIS